MGAKVIETLLAGLTDSSGGALSGGKVYTYAAGTTSDKTTWTDIDKATPAANPIILDANGRAQIFAEGAYKLRIDDADDSTLYTWDDLEFQSDTSTVNFAGDSGGSSSAYTLTNSPAATTYADGDTYIFFANHASTGASTINVDSLGVKDIKRPDGSAVEASDILNGALSQITYDSDNGYFKLASYSNVTISSGTYTPTISNTVNIDATVTHECAYLRIGDIVHVSGVFELDATTSSFATFDLTIPVASDFSTAYQLGGAGISDITAKVHFVSDSSSDKVSVTSHGHGVSNNIFSFSFMYQVI